MSANAAIWKEAEAAVVAGDLATLERLLGEHESLLRKSPPQTSWLGGLAPNYTQGDAQRILASEHHFETFEQLAEHLEQRKNSNSPIARFEAAVDAVVAGDIATLERLLRQDPDLIRARSTRLHHSMLLHYVGANGVEAWRQRTPSNAVRVVDVLMKAGAEVDAMADMYHGSTTLGLVATSIHPLRAGVQNDLIGALLNHGAALNHPEAAGNHQGIVNGCLANGRPGAAQYLACRGAHLDLEGAAGVGRLEVVRSFFNADGTLKPQANQAQLQSGLQWACEYGHTATVEFLLRQKIEVGEVHRGQTALHWASFGGYTEIVRLLLERNAPAGVKDERWQNTPLGWALHGWGDPPEGPAKNYYDVVRLLVAAGSPVEPQQLADARVQADPRMLAALNKDQG